MTATNAGTPDPDAWPECGECNAAFILRRALSLSRGWTWVWMRDCKHKKSEARVATKEAA